MFPLTPLCKRSFSASLLSADATPKRWRSEAIERFVNYDEWFVNEVEMGLEQIARGEVLSHEQVGARVGKLLSDKHLRT